MEEYILEHIHDWFTIEKIDLDTFVISEYKHWEETHCYLLCGNKQAVLIDTGLGVSNIRKVIEQLTPLPILVLTTHVHWDHIGGHHLFENISVHKEEQKWMESSFPLPLQVVKSNLTCKPCDFPKDFILNEYKIHQSKVQPIVNGGDTIDLGNRTIQIIHTPGHSPGHCCFYEPERKYLYSGDLIYKGCLDAFYPTTNPILFYDSLKKIQTYSIDKILPGHHTLNIECNIIDEITNAFSQLKTSGTLYQGAGLFDFGDFQIHI